MVRQDNKLPSREWCVRAFWDNLIGGPMPPLDDAARRLDRAVYKGTDCGAWLRFDADGTVKAGSIVEGSDAEFCEVVPTADLNEDEAGAAEFCRRVWQTLDDVNSAACEAWDEANGEDAEVQP